MIIENYISKPSLTILTMIETIKVSSKGQIVIPERIRIELGIKEGTKLVLIEKNNSIVIEKEDQFINKLNNIELEKLGWLALAEKSLNNVWNNKKDEEVWGKYL